MEFAEIGLISNLQMKTSRREISPVSGFFENIHLSILNGRKFLLFNMHVRKIQRLTHPAINLPWSEWEERQRLVAVGSLSYISTERRRLSRSEEETSQTSYFHRIMQRFGLSELDQQKILNTLHRWCLFVNECRISDVFVESSQRRWKATDSWRTQLTQIAPRKRAWEDGEVDCAASFWDV